MLASEPVGGYLGRPSFFAEFNPLNSTKSVTCLHAVEQEFASNSKLSWS